MGTGHVMRCLALAQAWQDAGGQAVIAMADSSPAIVERLLAEGLKVEGLQVEAGTTEDALRTSELANKNGAAWIVVDGYQFGADYQRALKDAGHKLLFVDDNGHAGRYCADLVLNQNVHASEHFYRDRSPQTRLLLGLRYVFLRREFNSWRNWQRGIPLIGRKVLLTMGGSDPDNLTLKVIKALSDVKVDGLEATVVVGGGNPHVALLEAAIKNSTCSIRLVKNATNMPELMAWADIAVAGAGTTCWEMCLLGLPALLVIQAENQRLAAMRLAELGAAKVLEGERAFRTEDMTSAITGLLLSQSKRCDQSKVGRELLDGGGAARVVSILQENSTEANR